MSESHAKYAFKEVTQIPSDRKPRTAAIFQEENLPERLVQMRTGGPVFQVASQTLTLTFGQTEKYVRETLNYPEHEILKHIPAAELVKAYSAMAEFQNNLPAPPRKSIGFHKHI